MTWEYKRVLYSVEETITKNQKSKDKKYYKNGREINPAVTDSVEDFFNMLGSEGWELVTAVNLDSGINMPHVPVDGVIEYIFKRKK